MKYLREYTEEATTKLLKENGAFFAFSNDQFNKAKKEGVKYLSMGMGLICPKENCKTVHEGLREIQKAGIKQDLEENDKEAIIKRELSNHECYYTGDIEDCVDALKGYDITTEEIIKVYRGERLEQLEKCEA